MIDTCMGPECDKKYWNVRTYIFMCLMQKNSGHTNLNVKQAFSSFYNISSDLTFELKMCCVRHFLTGRRQSSFLRRRLVEPPTGRF